MTAEGSSRFMKEMPRARDEITAPVGPLEKGAKAGGHKRGRKMWRRTNQRSQLSTGTCCMFRRLCCGFGNNENSSPWVIGEHPLNDVDECKTIYTMRGLRKGEFIALFHEPSTTSPRDGLKDCNWCSFWLWQADYHQMACAFPLQKVHWTCASIKNRPFGRRQLVQIGALPLGQQPL